MSTSGGSASPLRTTAPGASTIRQVVTSPPWARDEPPSPELEALPISDLHLRPSTSVTSGSAARHGPTSSTATSFRSDDTTQPTDWRRWKLPQMINQLRRGSNGSPTRPRTSDEDDGQYLQQQPLSQEPAADASRLPAESGASYFPHVNSLDRDVSPNRRGRQLRLQIPRNTQSFTLAQSKTPGWATPWVASHAGPRPGRSRISIPDERSDPIELMSEKDTANMSAWNRKRRSFRNFILTNAYVPLMCRIANLSFTAATLGIAVRIRHHEISAGILGAVGISPLLAIIFSPLTLTHVLLAIYLEYFGRPLGLWRTASKLAHTLLEVFFICLWSGSVSVAFYDYFTSSLECVPPSANSWWNSVPPQPSPLPGDYGRREGGLADSICDDQLIIVCLEFIGLCMYNASLVISLFRIFEKVKNSTTAARNYA
ncbi:hypothetical protein BKA62DRAFT_227841 [Auriculariales sp. MPI-PUGE-AT-0066]|nr:hypothetical protein BKA62DRAFT_227841 [Auriculariales sp. MPI-PUGE-AT-0066]